MSHITRNPQHEGHIVTFRANVQKSMHFIIFFVLPLRVLLRFWWANQSIRIFSNSTSGMAVTIKSEKFVSQKYEKQTTDQAKAEIFGNNFTKVFIATSVNEILLLLLQSLSYSEVGSPCLDRFRHPTM